MKKKGIKKSRCAVEIDAEQMEYLRYYYNSSTTKDTKVHKGNMSSRQKVSFFSS
jgi:hypothetical protein